jgi:NitT/TauT family transport system substrate-binding protein
MSFRNLAWTFLALATLLSGCVKSCSAPETPLRIGTNLWPGYEEFYWARQSGILKPERYALVEFGSATENIRAFRSQQLEFAALTLDETMLLARDGIDAVILAVLDISNGADVIIASDKIKTFHDLKGKRVGFEDTALGGYMLNRALMLSGMSRTDITPRYFEVDQHEKAYTTGEVDAIVTFEPVKSKLLALGNKVIFSSKDIPGEVVDVLVVRRNIWESQRARCDELVDLWFKTQEHIRQNQKEATDYMASREKINFAEFSAALADLIIPDRSQSDEFVRGSSPKLLKSIQSIHAFLRET